jgi:Holliday junction resolvase
LVLTKAQRSKIAKQNRAKGYRVERNDVLLHRQKGIFAFRIPTKQQRGDLATWDVIVCLRDGPDEVHQCKSRSGLMLKLERENHIRTVTYYGLIPVHCYNEKYKGLKFEVLK